MRVKASPLAIAFIALGLVVVDAGPALAQAPGTATIADHEALSSQYTPRKSGKRKGLMFGASVGRGSIAVECDICRNVAPLTEALSLTAHVGMMVSPRLAVLAEHWTVRYNDRGDEWFDDSADHLVAQRITTLSGQVWLGRRLWVKAGAGMGKHISDSPYTRTATAPPLDGTRRARSSGDGEGAGVYTPAFTGAIGYEFAHRSDFAVDVQFRVGSTRRPAEEYQIRNTGIVFGVTWF